jgi:Tfp pilus assembly protein PilN
MPIDAVTRFPFALASLPLPPFNFPKGMKAVNLLPSDLRGAPKASAAITARPDVPRGPGAFIVLGALAFGVLALAGYVLTTNTIKERQSESSALTARQQAAEARAAALKPYAEFQQLANSRVATLKDLAGQRFDWDQTLRDLSRALPQNVTIKSLDGSLSGADATAAAKTGATGPTITLTGCTSTQSAVARLMARLHDVNGVTAVSLASSKKSETEGASQPTETSAGDSTAPCGVGRHPDFKVIIRFENSAATAASSATPAAPATAQPAGAAATPAPTPSAQPASTNGAQTSSTSTAGGAK